MVRKIRCDLLFAIGEVYFISEIYLTYIDRLNMKNILRELREKNNWTQRELSSKLGVGTPFSLSRFRAIESIIALISPRKR